MTMAAVQRLKQIQKHGEQEQSATADAYQPPAEGCQRSVAQVSGCPTPHNCLRKTTTENGCAAETALLQTQDPVLLITLTSAACPASNQPTCQALTMAMVSDYITHKTTPEITASTK